MGKRADRAAALHRRRADAASGYAVATSKTARVAHPVLPRPLYSVALSGFVEARDIRERSDRIVLRVTAIESDRHAITLTRVRLAVRKGTAPDVGSFVQLKARLLPPLAPVRPGSYDFARDMFFQGIGASGFVMGGITTLTPPQEGGFGLRYGAAMQGLRDAIDARIRAQLDGDERAIATALLTGRRDAITPDVNDAMFISGLGHVLSISGYHMAVVAGVVFFAVRALLALIPGLTVSLPIKKWAAAAALVAAAFYLLLSGAEVATQRSFFMTAIVLIAVMVDRRAVTFRTLAVAAMIVLIAAPEALVHPSFQMSFAATLGLVALVQFGLPRLFATPDSSVTERIALWGGRELAMLLLASLIAGLATTPYAAFHFHRITPYGVLANLAAMPVVSALVMPAGLLGLLAAPFGLDGLCWTLMGWGIDWMIAVTRWVAALPGRRTRHGVRHRSADPGQFRAPAHRPVADTAALVGRGPDRYCHDLVRQHAAAGHPDFRRRTRGRRARARRSAACDADRQGCVRRQGVAGGRCRSARAVGPHLGRRGVLRRVRLCDGHGRWPVRGADAAPGGAGRRLHARGTDRDVARCASVLRSRRD